MVNIVETLVMRVSFVVFMFPSCCFQSLRNSSNHDKAQMCIISCPSVYPVVGVRQGATGPGRRPRATPVQEQVWFSKPTPEFTLLTGNSFK